MITRLVITLVPIAAIATSALLVVALGAWAFATAIAR